MLSLCCIIYRVRVLFSALTTTCEIRTISSSRISNVDFVIGKLAVDEYLYDKTKKRLSSVSSPYTQTKVIYRAIFVLSNLYAFYRLKFLVYFERNIKLNLNVIYTIYTVS